MFLQKIFISTLKSVTAELNLNPFLCSEDHLNVSDGLFKNGYVTNVTEYLFLSP